MDIEMPKIHETALLRLRSGGNAYAPLGMPARYAVAMSNGQILQGAANPYETPAEADARAGAERKVGVPRCLMDEVSLHPAIRVEPVRLVEEPVVSTRDVRAHVEAVTNLEWMPCNFCRVIQPPSDEPDGLMCGAM